MTGEADDVERFFHLRINGHYKPEADIFDDLMTAAKHVSKVLNVCLPVYELSVTVTDEDGCEVTW